MSAGITAYFAKKKEIFFYIFKLTAVGVCNVVPSSLANLCYFYYDYSAVSFICLTALTCKSVLICNDRAVSAGFTVHFQFSDAMLSNDSF